MKKTILVVAAVAGLALTEVGQWEKKQEPKKANEVTSPRDAASGQASGRKGNWNIKELKGAAQDDSQQASQKKGNYDVKKMEGAATDDSQASGNKAKPSAADDWQAQTARDAQSGKATGKMENVSAPADNSVKSPRDASTGMATGKRQHPAVAPNDPPKK